MTQLPRLPPHASDPLLLPAPEEPLARSRVSWPEPRRERPLTLRQRRFVEEYVIDLNASAAARRAGYSERTAGPISGQLMAKLKIKEALRTAMDARSQRLKISAERVRLEIARIAFSDIGRIVDWTDDALKVKPLGLLTLDDRAAISEFAVIPGDGERGLAVKVKLHDKQKALQLLARHLRLYGPFAIQHVESPAKDAERARALILERLRKLAAARTEEQQEVDVLLREAQEPAEEEVE